MRIITFIFAIIISTFCMICNAANNAIIYKMQHDIDEVYNKFKSQHGGKNASYIPALKNINPNLFGIAIATVDGKIWMIGDAEKLFAIESISKPFMYALALQDNGDQINDFVGLNATGSQFNSIIAIEQQAGHRQNPFVNAGAIQITDYIKGVNSVEKWQRTISFLRSLSDSEINLSDKYYQSESATNQHNLAISSLLASYGLIKGDPYDALDRYTRACSVVISARQLAIMGSVLANGGVHPITHQRLIEAKYVKSVLSQMAINGMYENSGMWWTEVGLPSKSGVGGGILAIVPNKMAIIVYSPPLDEVGNSVRGQLVIRELSKKWNLHLLAS